MIASLLLSASLLLTQGIEDDEADAAFNFYLKEMIVHELGPDAPMSGLIENYLVEATFDTNSEAIFKDRLRKIGQTLHEHPDKMSRFANVDAKFSRIYDAKLRDAKQKRWIYSVAGAVIGAVIGLPVGKAISSNNQILWVSIPVGALVGAGGGFLLGHLIEMPSYSYEHGSLNSDLKEIQDELDQN